MKIPEINSLENARHLMKNWKFMIQNWNWPLQSQNDVMRRVQKHYERTNNQG